MAVSTTLSPLGAIFLAAAGMTQRWQQQTRSAIQIGRAWQARQRAKAKRREALQLEERRKKAPAASHSRSMLYLQGLALEHEALAFDAIASGDAIMAANYQDEATWFAKEARYHADLRAIFPVA